MEEIWRKIEEYPYFSISNFGRVRNDLTNYIKKNTMSNIGYYVTSLYGEGKPKRTRLIHRLLAIAFIPNDDPEKDCINHIDGDKTNNSLDNLEWCTKAENNHHAIKKGLYGANKPIASKNVETGEIKEYNSAREAHRETGIDYRQISDVCRGVQHTAHGYYWKFI